MRTMITTRKDKTTLTIETSEDLYLEQTGVADHRIKLTRNVNNIVPVGAGVFWILSRQPVSVTADSLDVQITTTGDKDGGPIEPLDAKGQSAPQ